MESTLKYEHDDGSTSSKPMTWCHLPPDILVMVLNCLFSFHQSRRSDTGMYRTRIVLFFTLWI